MQNLLNFNNHYDLHYSLPNIASTLDPMGVFVPTIVCNKINKKEFLCETLEDIPRECEWTRYAGHYYINSKPWRRIAKVACKIAVEKTETEREYIFSDLMDKQIETFKGAPGRVPNYFYNKVEKARRDFNEEIDSNIKKFMRWRLKNNEKRLEGEQLRIDEEKQY